MPPAIVRDDRKTVEISKEEQDSERIPVQERTEEEEQAGIRAAYATHIGTRQYQQDSLYLSDNKDGFMYAVLCDGMGGMDEGDKVSADVVAWFVRCLEKLPPETDIPQFFVREIRRVNDFVLEEYGKRAVLAGTTFTCVVIRKNHLYWASVGDSRIYIIRGNEIVQMTRDHNYAMKLEQMVQDGSLTREEAEKNPQKEALISYIGAPFIEIMDVSKGPFSLQEGDVVLSCSDGLTKSLGDEDILQIVKMYGGSIQKAAHMLTSLAFDTGDGEKDNTSVILIRYPFQ